MSRSAGPSSSSLVQRPMFMSLCTPIRKWYANNGQIGVFLLWGFDPKSTKTFFYGSPEPESALFSVSPASECLCGPHLQVTARTNHGNPAVPVRQSTHLGSCSGAAVVLKARFLLNCAPPPHPATKPSRGWLQVGGSKPRLVLITSDPTRTKVTAKERTDVLGCTEVGSTRWGIKRPAPRSPGVRRCSSRRLDAPRACPRRAGHRGASPGPTRPRAGRQRPRGTNSPPREVHSQIISTSKIIMPNPLFGVPKRARCELTTTNSTGPRGNPQTGLRVPLISTIWTSLFNTSNGMPHQRILAHQPVNGRTLEVCAWPLISGSRPPQPRLRRRIALPVDGGGEERGSGLAVLRRPRRRPCWWLLSLFVRRGESQMRKTARCAQLRS